MSARGKALHFESKVVESRFSIPEKVYHCTLQIEQNLYQAHLIEKINKVNRRQEFASKEIQRPRCYFFTPKCYLYYGYLSSLLNKRKFQEINSHLSMGL